MVAASVDVTTPDEAQSAMRALPLGVLVYNEDVDIDGLLAQCSRILARLGYRLGGVIQSNPPRLGRRKCDMQLTDLSSGETALISHDQGHGSSGCRLDLAALARAAFWVEQAVAAGADLVIINKFGKQEARGQGLRSAITEALLSGTPVVFGVSRLNLDACLEFAGGQFTQLELDPDAVVAWCRQVVDRDPPGGGDHDAAA
jgi:nucleoside-triphosphatase THEP1